MSFDYAELAETALEILSDFGADVIITRVTTGTYDPTTGANAVTTSNVTVKGVVLDYRYGETQLAETNIQAGDKRLLLEAAATPGMNDRFTANGKMYAAVSIGEVNPAGTNVLWDIHVRAN